MTTNFISAKLEARPNPEKGVFGLFAREHVAAGELLLVWGGRVVGVEELRTLSPRQQAHSVQVEEDLYLVGFANDEPDAGDYINHSCEPNAGLRGQIAVVAMRNIEANEEICFDYAMSDGSPYDEFVCACGQAGCRGVVRGTDWQRPELQARYAGYFSPYLQRRIAALKEN
ncbi:MAG: SET domain-containing protein-lysine N-methyltransferase [Anaerolineales bacterium]|nr:SET domain-containing protein-lysine N-methyltransferase [Anaerolineales bacterium]MCB8954794.1 SET domain-containing protein-lysine N-methyltransferase [Ardenticatenales bacterium]